MTEKISATPKMISEMTLEELWELFPIELVAHDDVFCEWYDHEQQNLTLIIPKPYIFRISHIGSTALKGIVTKRIVDILLETNDSEQMSRNLSLLNASLK